MNYALIESLIKSADNIIVTAHKNIDYDALGAILGMYYVASSYNKDTHVVIDDESESHEIARALELINKNENIDISRYKDVKNIITNKTLLIICDTNSSVRIQNNKLLNIKNKIILDHHSTNDNTISDVSYMYNNEEASSAVEIILEVIDNLNIYIPSFTATIMLTGIYVDTYGFLKKTTDMTHHYASLLYKFGIDLVNAREFLKQDFNEYKRRKQLLCNAKIHDGIAIASSNEVFNRVSLAKVSDELLIFDNVEASFTIAKVSDDTVGVSARSMGKIDVGSIMSEFGGGGHKYEAACEIKDTIINVEEKINLLLGR